MRICYKDSLTLHRQWRSTYHFYKIGHYEKYDWDSRDLGEHLWDLELCLLFFTESLLKKVQDLNLHRNCVRNPSATNFIYLYPFTCKSLQKPNKSYKVFMAVQLQTFCTSIKDLVIFLVNWDVFANFCNFVQLFVILFQYMQFYTEIRYMKLRYCFAGGSCQRWSPEVVTWDIDKSDMSSNFSVILSHVFKWQPCLLWESAWR